MSLISRPLFATLTLLTLAACGNGDRGVGFGSIAASGFADVSDIYNGEEVRDSNPLGNYRAAAGNERDVGLRAYSEINLNSASYAPPPDTGTVNLAADYEVIGITDLDGNYNRVEGYRFRDSGAITLIADYENGRLRGTSNDQQLRIEGDFTRSGRLTGEVAFSSDGPAPGNTNGELKGHVSSGDVLGAFHGGTEKKEIYAGGIATR
ncbi:hypothetical protein [Mesobacterium pallidum]|uniref:hypothetical protein n=1 Tax=Mesobacterium pallidum TaxID=2872037 RepID=UPI001EE2F02B|nr:hypothetical protein [Mesobacterium pallidum]